MLELNNGKKIPKIGLGTWRITGDEKVEDVLRKAIKLGYRHIDTAHVYENEESIGKALKKLINEKLIRREELFITSKLWNSFHKRPDEAIKRTLSDLQLDYVDLYLIHWPVCFKYDEKGNSLRDEHGKFVLDTFDIEPLWKKMEEFVEKGYVKSIGVSNFGIKNMEKLLSFCKIKPVMCQIEMNPYLKQTDLINYLHSKNIAVTSYSSLGSTPENKEAPDLKNDSVIVDIARRRNLTVAQVILSWISMKNIVVIPKSTSELHLKENLSLYALEDEDVKRIENIETVYRFINIPDFGPERFD